MMNNVNNPWQTWRPVHSGAEWVAQSATLQGAAYRERMRQGDYSWVPESVSSQPRARRPRRARKNNHLKQRRRFWRWLLQRTG